MTVSKFTQPDYGSQSGTSYPLGIDKAIAVLRRLAGAFAPREQDAGSPSPDMTVIVDAGFVYDGTVFAEKTAQTVTGFTTPSAGQHRYDRVVIDNDTGDAIRIAGTAAAGSPTASLPAIPYGCAPCALIYITSADTAVTNAMITDERALLSAPPRVLTQETTLSGAAVTWTFPAGAKRISVSFANLSTSGTSALLWQLGDAGGVEATGYLGAGSSIGAAAVATANYTTGFGSTIAASTSIEHGLAVFERRDPATNAWVAAIDIGFSDAATTKLVAGSKSLSAELISVVLTTVGGTDTFDGGTATIKVEY